MDNSFILTDNFNEVANAAIFYSEQPGYDYTSWIFRDNCLLQSDYPFGVKNEYFTPPDTRWETAFADKCTTYIPTPEQTPEQTPDATITQTPESTPEQTPDPTCNLPDNIFHDGNCNLNLRCHYTAREGDQICVLVWISEFNGYSRSDEDGGAIHVVDSGLQCNQTNFTSCMSMNGRGGAVYYKNSFEFVNNLTFVDLRFIECKAVCGGAVYIYSSSDNNNITLNYCTFINNQVLPQTSSNSNNELFGGSSIFLTSKSIYVMNCSFNKGKGTGGSVKIYNVFDSNLKKTVEFLEDENIFLFSNCNFDTDKDYFESILYISYNTNNNKKTRILNCLFDGKFVDETHSFNDKSKVIVDSCTFNFNLQKTINIKSINYSSYSVLNDKKSLHSSHLAYAVVIGIIMLIIFGQKKKTALNQINDKDYIDENLNT